MRKTDTYPLAVAYGYKDKRNKINFVGRMGTIAMSGKSVRRICNILKYCNGLRDIEEIRSLAGENEKNDYYNLINLLFKNSIICDSRDLYQQFHVDSGNPMPYSHDLGPDEIAKLTKHARKSAEPLSKISLDEFESPFTKLVRSRKTIRSLKDGVISKGIFSGLFECMYRIRKGESRSVPSAGAMYPLQIYILALRSIDDIGSGFYQYLPDKHCLNPLEITVSRDEIDQILNNSEIAPKAVAVIFLAADFKKIALKYANRGYRCALIEAGHVMQNAYLFCAENNLALVEYGGFRDDLMKKALQMNDPSRGLIISAVIGIPDEESKLNIFDNQFTNDTWTLRHKLIGKDLPIKNIFGQTINYKGYSPPFNVAVARYRSVYKNTPQQAEKRNLAFGTGASIEEAELKALSEAYERFCSGKVKIDVYAKERELMGRIFDLCRISPLREDQLKRFRLKLRNPGETIGWVAGKKICNSETVYIPVDQVFYPLFGKNLSYLANSTGVAAHFSVAKACENALMELIERDAIAVTWYARREVSAIPKTSLDESLQKRINWWEKNGRTVKILDITTDSIPVVLVMIFGEKYPCLATGAGAHYDWLKAAEKALTEAEFMLISWHQVKRRVRNVENIKAPHEHGIFYFSRENSRHLNWLRQARESTVFPQNRQTNILEEFDPLMVDLTPNPSLVDLRVVRVLSEKLMPLTFGYGNEHYGHPRVEALGLKWYWDFPSQPHFFA